MKIGIISPSNNVLKVFPNRRITGLENLKMIGASTCFSKNAIRYNDSSSKSVKERLDEFNEIMDSNVDLIMASIGGYTSIQLLDKLDYDKIKKKKLKICGFSDITAILLSIYTKTRLEMLYGPVFTVNLCDYGGVDSYTKEGLLNALGGNKFICKPSDYSIKEFIDWKDLEESKIIKKKELKENDWKIVNKGKGKGKLIGGNLATMLLILGTEYLPIDEFKDSILFLEECNTNILKFTSYLESLKLKGIFNIVNGVIFGKFDSDDMNNNIEEFLKEYFNDYNIPVACNLDFGHVFPIFTIPIGRNATLECEDKSVYLEIEDKKKQKIKNIK